MITKTDRLSSTVWLILKKPWHKVSSFSAVDPDTGCRKQRKGTSEQLQYRKQETSTSSCKYSAVLVTDKNGSPVGSSVAINLLSQLSWARKTGIHVPTYLHYLLLTHNTPNNTQKWYTLRRGGLWTWTTNRRIGSSSGSTSVSEDCLADNYWEQSSNWKTTKLQDRETKCKTLKVKLLLKVIICSSKL